MSDSNAASFKRASECNYVLTEIILHSARSEWWRLLLCHLKCCQARFTISTVYLFCFLYKWVSLWLVEFLLLSLFCWVYGVWISPLSFYPIICLVWKAEPTLSTCASFHRIVCSHNSRRKEKSQTLSKLCFYSVPLNGSIMDVLDWQKHQKANGTVHSVQLQWRGEAADINKYLHLENKLLTKGFMGDLRGGRNPHHTSSQPLKEGLT